MYRISINREENSEQEKSANDAANVLLAEGLHVPIQAYSNSECLPQWFVVREHSEIVKQRTSISKDHDVRVHISMLQRSHIEMQYTNYLSYNVMKT